MRLRGFGGMRVNHTSAANTGTSSRRAICLSKNTAKRRPATARARILASALALILHGRSMAADAEASPDAQGIEELDVTARKQSALDSEAISLSDTPEDRKSTRLNSSH